MRRRTRQGRRERAVNHHRVPQQMSYPIPYSKEESQYKVITKNLAVFVGAGNISNSMVTNEDFRKLLQSLDPCYSVPGKVAISH